MVEDEADIARSVAYSFKKDGWETRVATNGEAGLDEVRVWRPDLVVLDVILPGMDGFEVCRRIRKESAVPIIMLTAKTSEIDRVVGLELGADDYVLKPFSMRELLARARAVLRRSAAAEELKAEPRIEAGDLMIDREMRVVTLRDKVIDLRLKEYELLCLLAEYPGRTMTRKTIFEKVWGNAFLVDSRTLDVHMRWLREKLEEEPSNPKMLLTVRGVGYKFAALPAAAAGAAEIRHTAGPEDVSSES